VQPLRIPRKQIPGFFLDAPTASPPALLRRLVALAGILRSERVLRLLLAVAFLAAGGLGLARAFVYQDPVSVNDGLGWDGVHYDRLLRWIVDPATVDVLPARPFSARVGSALVLAAVDDPRFGHRELNLLAGALFVVALVVGTRPFWRGDPVAFAAAVGLAAFLFFAPLRYAHFHPVYVDPPYLLLTAVSAGLLWRGRYLGAILAALAAVPFRESALVGVVLAGGTWAAVSDRPLRAAAITAGFVALGLGLHAAGSALGGGAPGSSIAIAGTWLYRFVLEPTRPLAVIAAALMTIGPWFVLRPRPGAVPEPAMLAVRVGVVAAVVAFGLAAVGGCNATRIFYGFCPFYAAPLLVAFRGASVSSAAVALLSWVIVNRMLDKYHEPRAVEPAHDLTGFYAQFPDYAHPSIALAILAVWALAALGARFLTAREAAWRT